MQKELLRLSKYYVQYTIHEAENVNTYHNSEYSYHFKNTVMENTE